MANIGVSLCKLVTINTMGSDPVIVRQPPVPAFIETVKVVFFRCARKQVIGLETGRVVAPVTAVVGRIFSVCKEIRIPVNQNILTVYRQFTVSSPSPSSLPFQAPAFRALPFFFQFINIHAYYSFIAQCLPLIKGMISMSYRNLFFPVPHGRSVIDNPRNLERPRLQCHTPHQISTS